MSPHLSPLLRIPIAILALAAAAAAESKSTPPGELAEAIEWFNQLTVPDVKGKPYVEVVTHRYAHNGKVYENKRRGFLLAEDETAWTLVPDGVWPIGTSCYWTEGRKLLRPVSIAKPEAVTLPGASPDKRVLDLRKAAAEIVAQVEKKMAGSNDMQQSDFGRSGDGTAVFVLARLCERNGFAAAARGLDRAYLGIPVQTRRHRDTDLGNPDALFTRREGLEQDLGSALLLDTLYAFKDERVPRDELLARFEWLAKEFSGFDKIEVTDRRIDVVRSHLDVLRRMAGDDARPARDIATLPPDEQAREWIFRLRDQTEKKGGAFGSDMKVCVLEPPSYPGNTPDPGQDDRRPAQQLVNLGYVAVPALIEALSDMRFTRALQIHGMGRPEVVTIGDCAEEILERISGGALWSERARLVKTSRVVTPADLRPAAEKWWHELDARGESAVMADGIREGGQSSIELARHLVDRDPKSAMAALPEGIAHAETAWIRECLVEQLGRLPGDFAGPLLHEETARGRWQRSRVAAARVLYRHGDEEAYAAMINEWQHWEPAPGGRADFERYNLDSLVRFLIGAHRAEGTRALASRFGDLPAEIRVLIVETFASASVGTHWRSQVHPPWAPGEEPSLLTARRAAEELLLRALDDQTVNPATTYGGGDQPSWKARVCDHAAQALLSLRSGKSSGPMETTLAARDARVATLKKQGPQER